MKEASRHIQLNIPKSTLSLKNWGDNEPIIVGPGPKTILFAEEENKIVMCILESFDAKRLVTKITFRQCETLSRYK